MAILPLGREKRHCVFCGASKVTKEHVVPRWINDLLTARHPNATTWTTERLGQIRVSGSLPEIEVKRVCGPNCNNGWMAQLERDVKPFLSEMILGAAGALILSPQQQELLVQWTAKTVLMLDFTYPTQALPEDAYAAFYVRRRPPDQCAIWTAARSGPLDMKVVLLDRNEGFIGPSPHTLYPAVTITFAFMHAVFQVLWHFGPVPIALTPSPTTTLTQRLWPPAGFPLVWPPMGVAIRPSEIEEFVARKLKW